MQMGLLEEYIFYYITPILLLHYLLKELGGKNLFSDPFLRPNDPLGVH